MRDDFVVLDTETTGLNKDRRDEAVEISVVGSNGETVFDSLIRPIKVKSWAGAERIHRISADMVFDAPTFGDVWDEFAAAITGKEIYIYNARYDIGILKNCIQLAGVNEDGVFSAENCTDVMLPYAEFYGQRGYYGYKWQKLTNAMRQQRLTTKGCVAHRALGDAQMTHRLLLHMWEKGVEL